MTAISMTGMHALLKFMHTPDDIFKDAYAYVMLICGGIFAQALYNILASILRALGNSKIPLYFLILSAIGLLINEAVMYICIDGIYDHSSSLQELLSSELMVSVSAIIATGVVMVYNFISRKLFLERK